MLLSPTIDAGSLIIAVAADDAVSAEGALAFLGTHPRLTAFPVSRTPERPDFLVVLAERLTDTLSTIVCDTCTGQSAATAVIAVDALPRRLENAIKGCNIGALRSRRTTRYADIISDILGTPVPASGHPARRGDDCPPPADDGDDTTPGTPFTPREIDVIRLIAEGFESEQIAEQLSYSVRTVKRAVNVATTRHGLRNRTQLVAFALGHGLI